MAIHSILAWRIAQTEEPGGLHSMELQSRTRLSSSAQNSMITLRSIHIAANGIISFFVWLSNIPLYICTVSFHRSMDT